MIEIKFFRIFETVFDYSTGSKQNFTSKTEICFKTEDQAVKFCEVINESQFKTDKHYFYKKEKILLCDSFNELNVDCLSKEENSYKEVELNLL